MRKLNLKKIITMGLITTSILAVTPISASAAWKKDGTGWWYQNDNGVGYKIGWMQQNGLWYYFDNSGYMKTGWLNDNGTWYYFKGDGSMVTGNVIIGTNMNSFSNTGAWLGTTTNSNTSSTASTLSAKEKIDRNYSNMKSFFDKNVEYVLSDSEFTKDVAIELATRNANIYSADGLLHGTLTFGGYNSLPAVTSAKDVEQMDASLDGSMNHYKVWLVGLVNGPSGNYEGIFEVYNNGYVVYNNPGLYHNSVDQTFNEKTFDKNDKFEQDVPQSQLSSQTAEKQQEKADRDEMDKMMTNPAYRQAHQAEYEALVEKLKNK